MLSQAIYRKLKKTIAEEVAILRLRQGVFGKDRIKSVNYYFKEMVEMLLP